MEECKAKLKNARTEFTHSRKATEEMLLSADIDVDTLRAVNTVMKYRANALEDTRRQYLHEYLNELPDDDDSDLAYEEEKKKQTVNDVVAIQAYERILKEVEEKIATLLENTEPLQPEFKPVIKYPLQPTKPQKKSNPSGASSATEVPETPGQDPSNPGKPEEKGWRFRGEEIKYPRLHLPEFEGSSVVDYWNFLEQFRAFVDTNPRLGAITKFSHLRSCLKGKAYELVRNIPYNEQCYNLALERLEQEYASLHKLKLELRKRIIELKPVSNSRSVPDLKKLLLEARIVSETQSRFETLSGRSCDSETICDAVVNKLPPDMMTQFFRERDEGEEPKAVWDEILDFLRREIRIREDVSFQRSAHAMEEQGDFRKGAKQSGAFMAQHSIQEEVSGAEHFEEQDLVQEEPYTVTPTRTNFNPYCVLCKANGHWSTTCPDWLGLSVNDRRGRANKEGRCFLCLKTGHRSQICTKKNFWKCRQCGACHNILLCGKGGTPPLNAYVGKVNKDSQTITAANSGGTAVALQTLVAKVMDVDGRYHEALVFLDSGSQSSFVSKNFVSKLGLKALESFPLEVKGFGKKVTRQNALNFKCHIAGLGNFNLPCWDTLCEVPLFALSSHYREYIRDLGYPLADPGLLQRQESNIRDVDILIGVNEWSKIVTGTSVELNEGLSLLHTKVGWVLWGASTTALKSVVRKQPGLTTLAMHGLGMTEVDRWICDCKLEPDLFPPKKSIRDEELWDTLQAQTTREVDGRYCVRLPFKSIDRDLGENFAQAKFRLEKVMRKLEVSDRLDPYRDILEEQEQRGIIEKDFEALDHGYFLPHRPVIKENRSTTKVRIIYDASAVGKGGKSLNEFLEQGPNLFPNLTGLLLRFRKGKYVVTADVEKAFHQVAVASEDRHYLRFLWKEVDSLVSYRFARLPFGLVCSPYLLGGIIKLHLLSVLDSHPQLVNTLQDSIYVDDLLVAVDSEEECIALFREAQEVFASAKLPLRKWFSNSKECQRVMKQELNECLGEQSVTVMPNPIEALVNDGDFKVLGMNWNGDEDVLYFNTDEIHAEASRILKPTKRQLLSLGARLFDPLGLVAPILTPIRVLIQKMWLSKKEWDEEIDDSDIKQFRKWYSVLPSLADKKWTRWCGKIDEKNTNIHLFSDASMEAYGVGAYVVQSGDQNSSHLLLGKVKVAPLRMLKNRQEEEVRRSVPQLELMAATLSVQLAEFLKAEKFIDSNVEVTFWTDAKTVLSWLNNPRIKMDIFVRNRVKFILRYSRPDQWRYCPTDKNPADLPSRGKSLTNIQDFQLWVHGPEFLVTGEYPSEDVIERPINASVDVVGQDESGWTMKEFLGRYSTCRRMLRSVRLGKEVVKKWRRFVAKKSGKEFSEAEVGEDPEVVILRKLQEEDFGSEVRALKAGNALPKGSPLKELRPYMDQKGLIRVQGRLEESGLSHDEKHPIICKSNNAFFRAMIRKEHINGKHVGVSTLLALFRTKYWLFQGRVVMKRVLSGCPVCRRYQGRPFSQDIAELPRSRIEASRAFQTTGIDFFGPLASNTLKKAYGCIFSCAASRAIHIELVRDLKAPTFWRALRRFVSRRGIPDRIISDNATTFIKSREDCEKIKQWLLAQPQPGNDQAVIEWDHIVPRAPWWGGFYERLIGSVKGLLRKHLHRSTVNLDELVTILVEIEAIINDRPLTYFPEQDTSYNLITPARLMFGTNLRRMPYLGTGRRKEDVPEEIPSRRARIIEDQIQAIWKAWKREYVAMLQTRKGSWGRVHVPEMGQIVLIMDQDRHRRDWSLGKVEELFFSRDNRIRSVRVKTERGELVRAIQSLVPLECSARQE